MSNRWVISWLVIDYWRWSMSNRWVIEAQTFCGLSITHRWHRLLIDVIDYSSMIHRLLIDYYNAHERHFSCFLVPFFFVSDSFICVRRIFPCIWRSWRSCFTGMRKRAASSTQIGGRNFRICRKWPWGLVQRQQVFIARSYWRICKTEQPWRGNRQGVVQQQIAKRYWRTFWTLISMYYLSWKE